MAEQSRVGAPWYYRLAGVWGGMEGSLLLFTRHRRRSGRAWRPGAPPCGDAGPRSATVLALALVDVLLASPFGRLDVPATIGFGMNPILEHPAMAIHPPMLYAGLAAAGGAAVVAVGAPDPWPVARRWLLASVALADRGDDARCRVELHGAGLGRVLGMGSGGEHVAARLDGRARGDPRRAPARARPWRSRPSSTPWTLAVLGGALVRSGRTPSVHGFAEQLGVGWAMFGARDRHLAREAWLFVRRRDDGGLRTQTPTGDV